MHDINLVINRLLKYDNIVNRDKVLEDLTNEKYCDLVLSKILETSNIIIFRCVSCSLCNKLYLAYNCIMKYNVKVPDRYYCLNCEVYLPWYLKGDINIEILFK